MQIIFTESFLYNSSFPRTKHQCILFSFSRSGIPKNGKKTIFPARQKAIEFLHKPVSPSWRRCNIVCWLILRGTLLILISNELIWINQSIIDVPLRLMLPQPQSTRTNSRRASQHQSPSLTTNLRTTVSWDCKETNPISCHFLVVYVFEYLPEQNWLGLWKYWRRDRCFGDSNNHNLKHNCYNYNFKLKCKMFLVL